MSSKLFWPILIIVSAVLTGILIWSNSADALRPILTFSFMLVIPGLAFTRLLHLEDFLSELVLAFAVSLVVSTLLSEVMVFSHLWSPSAGIAILIGISLLGASLQIKNILQSSTQGGE